MRVVWLLQREEFLVVQFLAILLQYQIYTFAQILTDRNSGLVGEIFQFIFLTYQYIGRNLSFAFGQGSLLLKKDRNQ